MASNDKTVYEGDATVYEDDTVFDGDATVFNCLLYTATCNER